MKNLILGTTAVLSMTAAVSAGSATFTVLGPGFVVDMSPDGQFVAGWDGTNSWIWSEAGGFVNAPGGDAVAVSNDGTTLFGEIQDPESGKNVAALWTMATGWVGLGGLPGETGCDANLSNPYDMSGDAGVGVGLGWEGCSGRAFRWTEDTGMLALPQIGPNSARANAVSDNGALIGGWDEAANGTRRASVWTECSEFLPLEGFPTNPSGAGEVWGFSTDGSIVVGQGSQDLETGGGFRYIDGKIDIIPPLPDTDPVFHTIASFAVSDDGARVIGTNLSGFGPFAPRDGTYWTEDTGVEKLQDVLEAAGADVPSNLIIASGDAISADGTIIAGFAKDELTPFAFIATLPSTECTQDLDGDGMVGMSDLLDLLSAWGPCP